MDLKKFRKAADISQTQLADRSGVDVSIISRLESGATATASYENTVRLARALNLEPEELVPVALKPKPFGKRRPPTTRRRAETSDPDLEAVKR